MPKSNSELLDWVYSRSQQRHTAWHEKSGQEFQIRSCANFGVRPNPGDGYDLLVNEVVVDHASRVKPLKIKAEELNKSPAAAAR